MPVVRVVKVVKAERQRRAGARKGERDLGNVLN
jgi:hypothetical protein